MKHRLLKPRERTKERDEFLDEKGWHPLRTWGMRAGQARIRGDLRKTKIRRPCLAFE